MNSVYSSGRAIRIGCLSAICATLFPVIAMGQTSGPGDVLVQAGVSAAGAAGVPYASDIASLGGHLLDAIRRRKDGDGKPSPSLGASHHAAVVAVRASGDTVSFQVYLPQAHRVVVAGDLTDWRPVSMVRQRGGWWGVALLFSGSVSRLHLQRDDGEWQPAPGLPVTRDEYGGTISLLAVPRDTDSAPHA